MLRADSEFSKELVSTFNFNETGFGGFLLRSPNSQKMIAHILSEEDGA